MAVRLLPVPPNGTEHYRVRVELDARLYTLEYHRNAIDGHWYIDIYGTAAQPVRLGVRLIDRVPLLIRCTSPHRPPGELVPLKVDDARWDVAYIEVQS